MNKKNTSQIQVRIDSKTKKDVREVLDDMGLDLSTAIKMFCKHIQNTGALPLDLAQCSHSHIMSAKNAATLRKASREAKSEGKKYSSVKSLMKDMYR